MQIQVKICEHDLMHTVMGSLLKPEATSGKLPDDVVQVMENLANAITFKCSESQKQKFQVQAPKCGAILHALIVKAAVKSKSAEVAEAGFGPSGFGLGLGLATSTQLVAVEIPEFSASGTIMSSAETPQEKLLSTEDSQDVKTTCEAGLQNR